RRRHTILQGDWSSDVCSSDLGHWGTTPGLNFIYVHLNRIIRANDQNMIYVCGPGHGGPGMVANSYLEGTYSELNSEISDDVEGRSEERRVGKKWRGGGGREGI